MKTFRFVAENEEENKYLVAKMTEADLVKIAKEFLEQKNNVSITEVWGESDD